MRRRARPLAAAAALAVVAAGAGAAEGPLALARLTLVERGVERGGSRAKWESAVEGAPLRTGEALRTGPEGTARLDLPWMSLALGPGSTLRFPDEAVLSATLEAGRAVIDAPEREALKLVTGEAEVYGRGRAVVRREGRATAVSCLTGSFLVASADRTVALAAGTGTVVRAGRAPSSASPLPAAPRDGLWPGGDPVYVAAGATLELRWTGDAPSYQVEVLPVGSEVVLLQRDVATAPLRVELPWEGAFRWRVSARDARGLEGASSAEGLIAVDPRID